MKIDKEQFLPNENEIPPQENNEEIKRVKVNWFTILQNSDRQWEDISHLQCRLHNTLRLRQKQLHLEYKQHVKDRLTI